MKRKKPPTEPTNVPTSIHIKPINWVGYDGDGISRTWGYTQAECLEMTKAHIMKRPDRGPLERWKIKRVVVRGENE